MLRRISLAFFLVIFCAGSAWPKWKPEEQEYLDNQFRTLQEQFQALKKQNDLLAAELKALRQDEAQSQAVVARQQRKLEDLEQLVSSLRLGSEENFSSLKAALTKLREQQEKSFKDLVGSGTETVAMGTAAASGASAPAAPAASGVRGYVTVVKGDDLTIDLGSSQGLRPGVRLQLYKATDLNTSVGEIEVTEVIDASTSHARVLSLNPGVKAEFSDIVRLR